MRSMLLTFTVLSQLAWADLPRQLNMPLGNSMTLSMPAPVSSVSVADPSLLEVSRQGRKVTFQARNTGSTEVVVVTAEGETHLRIYVAPDKYGMPN
jgi:Flp pilus assembly secretin CpaC